MMRKGDRTAAYRWSPSLGLPCAMVGRRMPCSPGSRIPSGLPHPGESRRHRAGWRDCRIRQGLTVATTARTTRFYRTHGPSFRRSFSSPVDGAGNLQTRRTWQRRSSTRCPGLTESNPPCPWLFAHDAAASTASPTPRSQRRWTAPQGRAGMGDTYAKTEFR